MTTVQTGTPALETFAEALASLPVALAKEELTVFYQPQFTVDGKSIASVEALARWNHPTLGWISPNAFIPFAEAHGLIEELGTFVLRRACRDAAQWSNISVAVNVSPLQFASPNLLDTIDKAIEDAQLPTKRLELEITEGVFFADPLGAKATMTELRAKGIRLALDDFGTGHASLSYLRTLPWDKVKIDKSFVDDLNFVTSAAIIHAVIALCRAIGLKITAEGVETEDQQRFLRLAGCHYLQGYLFSRPVSPQRIGELISANLGRA